MSTKIGLGLYVHIHNTTGIIAIRVIDVHSQSCNLSLEACLRRHLTPGVSPPETGDGVSRYSGVAQTALRCRGRASSHVGLQET